ncbi:UNVERIFIED_CONTAM: hypothetical protein RMT77_001338 [Armadillidium vulgare]
MYFHDKRMFLVMLFLIAMSLCNFFLRDFSILKGTAKQARSVNSSFSKTYYKNKNLPPKKLRYLQSQFKDNLKIFENLERQKETHYSYTNSTFLSSYTEITSYMKNRKWPLIIGIATGRLGNNIHNFALILVLQEMFPNFTYAISEKTSQFVFKVFDQETFDLLIVGEKALQQLPPNNMIVFQPRNNFKDVFSYVQSAITFFHVMSGKEKIFLIEAYPLDLFYGYENFLLNQLKIRKDLLEKAQSVMNVIGKTLQAERNLSSVTYVGIHVRRKDYIKFSKEHFGVTGLPGKEYFSRAYKYFKSTLKNPVFLICSDDTNYAKRAFKDYENAFVIVNKTAEEDFAILSSCSHGIMTVGSFGFWASFLTGGQVLYTLYKDFVVVPFIHPTKLGNSFDQFIGIDSLL